MSHSDAIKKDARDKLSRGQVITAVITDVDIDERGTAMSKYENIRTFVKSKHHELEWADTVQVKIADIRANSAEALVLEKRNEENK
jgi:predicted RNA-binding protein with RPS1 domain